MHFCRKIQLLSKRASGARARLDGVTLKSRLTFKFRTGLSSFLFLVNFSKGRGTKVAVAKATAQRRAGRSGEVREEERCSDARAQKCNTGLGLLALLSLLPRCLLADYFLSRRKAPRGPRLARSLSPLFQQDGCPSSRVTLILCTARMDRKLRDRVALSRHKT